MEALPLLELPADCLAVVLFFAGPSALRGALPLVCKQLHTACWEDAPWDRLCAEQHAGVDASKLAAAACIRRRRVVYAALERWAPRMGGWQAFDAFPFGMMVSFRWSETGSVHADVITVSIGDAAPGALAVERARLLEISFAEGVGEDADEPGICRLAERARLRLHGRRGSAETSASSLARTEAHINLLSSPRPDGVEPVPMRFIGEQYVDPGLFNPRSAQRAMELCAEVMEIEWPCVEQAYPELSCHPELEALSDRLLEATVLQGGWRRFVSDVAAADPADDDTAVAAGVAEEAAMNEEDRLADGQWKPPVGRYDQQPETTAGHDLRLAWLQRGIEGRGPEPSAAGASLGAMAQMMMGAVTSAFSSVLTMTDAADSDADDAAVPRLRMTLGRIPAAPQQPEEAAEVMMPPPGLFLGDYGHFYEPFNNEVIRLHYADADSFPDEDADEEEDEGEGSGWLCGTKVTGDMHVCMGMLSFRVRICAGEAADSGDTVEPPVWADASEAMRRLGIAGSDAVARSWSGYGTLSQMGGTNPHEQPGHLVRWTSGQLAFCWGRGQTPVLLHKLDGW